MFDRKSLVVPSWLREHDDRRTELFTLACFSLAPIAGSAVSFVVNAGAVGGVIERIRGIIRLSRDRAMRLIAIPIYIYCGAYILALAANPAPKWTLLLPVVTLLLFPFLYSSWCLSRHPTIARSAINGSMIACYGALLLAFAQFHFLGQRAEGGAGNAIIFAMVTTMASTIALAGAFSRSGMSATLLFGAYFAGSIAVLYSGARMSWVALFIASGTLLWVYRDRRHAWNSTIAVSGAMIGVLAVTLVAMQVIPARISALGKDIHELTTKGNFDTSLGNRGKLWEFAMEAVREKPFLGHGPQASKTRIRNEFEKLGVGTRYTHFHNGFLTAWVEAGLLGLLSLAGIFVAAATIAVRTLARTDNDNQRLGASILLSAVIVYVVNGLTGILIGHDILDAMLVTYLCVGTYLAAGTSILKPRGPLPDQREPETVLSSMTKSR